MVSTHFRRPGRPPARDLRIMELYGDFAGEAVARHLGVPDGDDLADLVGRAVISALLDPGDGHHPGVTVLPWPGDAGGDPPDRSASLEDTMSRFAADIVNRLFSVGISLESARSIVGKGPVGDRIAAAADDLDRLIRDFRTAVFSCADDREQHRPGRGPDW